MEFKHYLVRMLRPPCLSISLNYDEIVKGREKGVWDFESLLMAWQWQNTRNSSGNSHIVGIDKVMMSPIYRFQC